MDSALLTSLSKALRMKGFKEDAGAKLSKISFHYPQVSQHLGWEGVKWGTGPREPERGFKT